jgi:alpha-galactosidase
LISRRRFLRQSTAAGLALSWPVRAGAQPARTRPTSSAASFVDVRRPPDAIVVQTAAGEQRLATSGGEWRGDGLTVATREAAGGLAVRLSAPGAAVKRLHLRWRGATDATRLVLGDAWERGYGDLEWRGSVPDRALPWYFAAFDGQLTHGYGVRTGPSAFCYWQYDPHGVSLLADVRSGGSPVQLGERLLDVCEVVCREGRGGESAFAALHAFCRDMCAKPVRPAQPAYGSNDWYWAYGKNSADTILSDARRIVELSPAGGNRPLAVIDDGWQPQREDKALAGWWDRGNAKFGEMAKVAADVRRAGARPGIWIRPLLAASATPDAWRLPRDRAYLDPTVPDARQKIADDMARLRAWGFDLIKHDYTTFDLFGRWGFQMGTAMTRDGWTFAAGPAKTTAEVIGELYRAIRGAAGDASIIGCNTVSHLSAGVFDICRIGDDTSGMEWGRTRKMGVNTLAFRGVQHDAFYAADADCVGVTKAVPWHSNRQWLDLVARSGTALFVSLAPDAIGTEQARDLRAALALAAGPQPLGEPLDWQATVWPSRWRLRGEEQRYDWIGPDGAGGG